MKNKKSLGQHWLKDRVILDQIAELATEGLDSENNRGNSGKSYALLSELCLEIGPGLGTLTTSLLRRFEQVLAVEYDEKLAQNLPNSFPGKKLTVVWQDILEFDLDSLPRKYVVVGNIPYYITSPILRKVLTAKHQPEKVVLLVQKEVAERITSRRETVLSLEVKNRAEVELGPIVKKEKFVPPPEVDSQVIVLKPHAPVVEEGVLDLAKRAFVAPRKKVVHNLAFLRPKQDLEKILISLGLGADARPGDLKLEDWAKLFLMV